MLQKWPNQECTTREEMGTMIAEKQSNDVEAKLCFFRQARYDCQRHLEGYELLLRKHYPGLGWRVPDDINQMPFDLFMGLVEQALPHLDKGLRIMINLDQDQFVQMPVINAVAEFQNQHSDYQIVVELTERDNGVTVSTQDLAKMARRLSNLDLHLCLDDVGTGRNQSEQVLALLPYTDEIKFALQNFSSNDEESGQSVYLWRRLAQAAHKRFVLEGIETEQDEQPADSLDVNLRQGYYYGKPQAFY